MMSMYANGYAEEPFYTALLQETTPTNKLTQYNSFQWFGFHSYAHRLACQSRGDSLGV